MTADDYAAERRARLLVAEDREARLPVWARDLLGALRRELDSADRHAQEARLATSPDESDTVIRRYIGGNIGLGDGPTVLFRTPDGELEASLRDGALVVMTNGSTRPVVSPQSGNVLQVHVQPWR